MKIDPELCVSCEVCLMYCPLGAIHMNDVAEINQEICVECGNCRRAEVCPTDAFIYEAQPWPRSVREAFSNPLAEHKETRVPGRGTEEMKTNDVRGLYGRGIIGVAAELGRPGVPDPRRLIDDPRAREDRQLLDVGAEVVDPDLPNVVARLYVVGRQDVHEVRSVRGGTQGVLRVPRPDEKCLSPREIAAPDSVQSRDLPRDRAQGARVSADWARVVLHGPVSQILPDRAR